MPAEGDVFDGLKRPPPVEVAFMSAKTIHLFLNGELVDPLQIRDSILPGDVIIAVDGGYRHVRRLGLTPTMLIGDLDSVTPSELREAEEAGTRIIRYPVEKDQTDFELALEETLSIEPGQVFIHAGVGGRLDHTLTNLAVLSSERFAELHPVLIHGSQTIQFIHDSLTLTGKAGDLVSLIPWQGQVAGVQTDGFQYPLRGEVLYPDQSRGVSNVMISSKAVVSIQTGVLLCIYQPE
jgi:thiamine pyrophosphokinase